MSGFGGDRLTDTEAAEVMRLHTERKIAREAALQDARDRLAATTSVAEIAVMVGAEPEEILALTEEVRRRHRDAESRFRSDPFGLAIVLGVLGFLLLSTALSIWIPMILSR